MQSLSKRQMEELDIRMIHQYKLPLSKMMDIAVRGIASIIKDRAPRAIRTVVLAGSGYNGGLGLSIARNLALSGYDVRVIMTREEFFLKEISKERLYALPSSVMVGCSSNATDSELETLIKASSLVVDALLGYSLSSEPEGEVARLIKHANNRAKTIISVDLPSGLHPDKGAVFDSVIEADVTATLALPKNAMLLEECSVIVGKLYAIDIGVPDAWFKEKDIHRPSYGDHGYVFVKR